MLSTQEPGPDLSVCPSLTPHRRPWSPIFSCYKLAARVSYSGAEHVHCTGQIVQPQRGLGRRNSRTAEKAAGMLGVGRRRDNGKPRARGARIRPAPRARRLVNCWAERTRDARLNLVLVRSANLRVCGSPQARGTGSWKWEEQRHGG